MVLRDRFRGVDRQKCRRAAVAGRSGDRVRGDLAVDGAGGQIGIGLLVANGVGGFAGRKLHDLDLGGIDAILLQDHLEQVDVGRRAADHADAASGELRDLGDLRTGLLSLPLGLDRRGHPQHRNVLAQRRNRLRIFGHVEIAANDGEVDLAFGQCLGTRGGAVGLHRTQANVAVALNEALRQRLHHLDVVAVGGTHRDPQQNRSHRKIIACGERADDGENPRQHDEAHGSPRRTRRDRRLGKIETVGHRSDNRLRVNCWAANNVLPIDDSKFPALRRLHLRHG